MKTVEIEKHFTALFSAYLTYLFLQAWLQKKKDTLRKAEQEI